MTAEEKYSWYTSFGEWPSLREQWEIDRLKARTNGIELKQAAPPWIEESPPKNILDHAKEIVYDRKEEKERQYGDFHESMTHARDVFNAISGKELTTEDIYLVIISLKFSREYKNHKYDNMVDVIAYIASLHELKEKQNGTNR